MGQEYYFVYSFYILTLFLYDFFLYCSTSGGSLFSSNTELLQTLYFVSPPSFPGNPNQEPQKQDTQNNQLSDLASHPFFNGDNAEPEEKHILSIHLIFQ